MRSIKIIINGEINMAQIITLLLIIPVDRNGVNSFFKIILKRKSKKDKKMTK